MDSPAAKAQANTPRFYVSWMRPIKRARIHLRFCSHCNGGEGQNGQDRTGSGNTGWFGPFQELAAIQKAMSLVQEGFTDVGFCGTCLKGRKLPDNRQSLHDLGQLVAHKSE